MTLIALPMGNFAAMFTQLGDLTLMEGVNETLDLINDDWLSTVSTWKSAPQFDIARAHYEGQDIVGTVSTENEIMGYVNFGTVPHDIYPVNAKRLRFYSAFTPKTAARVVGSKAGGSSGDPVFSSGVHHPGSEARAFDEAIVEKRQPDIEAIIVQLLNQAAAGIGA